MKILVAANGISGKTSEGGSSRFMKCVIDELINQGHEITTNEPCDLVICSHAIDQKIKAKKVFISHGIVAAERCIPGANKYVSISEEVRQINAAQGFNSEVIPQPIKILDKTTINPTLQNILIIRRKETLVFDPFAFLADKYNVKYSDPDIPIEDQIKQADLCITLGRGALESMAQGVPVLVADNRNYVGAIGDGYLNHLNISEVAKCNFSGRRFKIPITQEWIQSELDKYNPDDANFLYDYVKQNHNVKNIVKEYLSEKTIDPFKNDFAFGCIYNNPKRLDLILMKSNIGEVPCFTLNEPDSASKGLNTLLDTIEKSGAKVGILAHQDMFFREHWLPQVKKQIELLPEDWVIAGIVGKDTRGSLCGWFHDMSSPLWIMTEHDFPARATCIDECVIIVNMESGFRFDEALEGFDLYGTYACLRANEIGSAWIINAWAEHYCTRFWGQWEPDEVFMKMWRWIYNRFPGQHLASTVLIGPEEVKDLKTNKDTPTTQACT